MTELKSPLEAQIADQERWQQRVDIGRMIERMTIAQLDEAIVRCQKLFDEPI